MVSAVFFRLIEIAHEQEIAPDQDFALGADHHFAPGCGLANRTKLDAVRRITVATPQFSVWP